MDLVEAVAVAGLYVLIFLNQQRNYVANSQI
jgi:hypothetical protein